MIFMKSSVSLAFLLSLLVLFGFSCQESATTDVSQPEPTPQTESMFAADGSSDENLEGDMIDHQHEEGHVHEKMTEPAPTTPPPAKPASPKTNDPAPSDPMPVPAPAKKTVTFNMTAKQWAFEPSKITVSQGDDVVINIKSVDVHHSFVINAYGIDVDLEPNEPQTIRFTADKKGTFSFFCDVFCGAGHSDMVGTMVVE